MTFSRGDRVVIRNTVGHDGQRGVILWGWPVRLAYSAYEVAVNGLTCGPLTFTSDQLELNVLGELAKL